MSAHIHLETAIPGAAPEQIYELLTNGAKFADVTGQPGKGGGAAGSDRSTRSGSPAGGASYQLWPHWLQRTIRPVAPRFRSSTR